MKRKKNKRALSFFLFFISTLFLLSSCVGEQTGKIRITDAKMATEIDEDLMPVKVASLFTKGTSKVFCWFKWRDAKIDTEVMVRWHYATDDIHVLDYAFKIPRKEGSGGITLSMPEGKILPSGSYRVDLQVKDRTLKSLTFRVE